MEHTEKSYFLDIVDIVPFFRTVQPKAPVVVLPSSSSDSQLDAILQWLKNTPPFIIYSLGIITVAGLGYHYMKSYRGVRNENERLASNNTQLDTEKQKVTEQNNRLKNDNEFLREESTKLGHRLEIMESRLMDMVETFTNQSSTDFSHDQVEMIKKVYREQLESSRYQNTKLREKIERLENVLYCSICLGSESNAVLVPCGHCVCFDCHNEIEKKAIAEHKETLCPFCRAVVTQAIPKY
eukprot:TRINITY_DN5708_c0_g1_i1.p1 TRINITY_DN5708_c0_g1~~TRINITY_DN5708_c0_g1_i1.p1  ORF type:complete len:239 (+),score=48.21 TRINITY_DN5708_c0_g1_i1:40-756(+)